MLRKATIFGDAVYSNALKFVDQTDTRLVMATIEPSPLRQDTRPEIFQPKVVQLYEDLFSEDAEEFEETEGFWKEFFLHRPEPVLLKKILGKLRPYDLLHLQVSVGTANVN